MEVFTFGMESKEVIRIALGTMTAENVLVRIRTADGVVGWGESSPHSQVTRRHAGDQWLAGIVRGKDPFDIYLESSLR
jgi:L-alanine-DL-glutamate epimerase-like enolase superfamily enzyme